MRHRWALIIGNSEYNDRTLSKLGTPGGDAADLAAVLRDPQIGGFEAVEILLNQPLNKIQRAIAHFFSRRKSDDLLLLYFSGHGVLDEWGQLFLAAKGTESDVLRGTALAANFITTEMDKSSSKRQVLILDCCHSGAFARGAKGVEYGRRVGTAPIFEEKRDGYGRVVMTATDATQYAWEGEDIMGEGLNSIFTRHLIHGLRSGEADRDQDGQVTLDEWFHYAHDQVVNQKTKQTPHKWSFNERGGIIVASNPHWQPPALPPELQAAIESAFVGVRLGAIQDLRHLSEGSDSKIAQAAKTALEQLKHDDSRSVSNAAVEALGEKKQEADIKPESQAEARPALRPAASAGKQPDKLPQVEESTNESTENLISPNQGVKSNKKENENPSVQNNEENTQLTSEVTSSEQSMPENSTQEPDEIVVGSGTDTSKNWRNLMKPRIIITSLLTIGLIFIFYWFLILLPSTITDPNDSPMLLIPAGPFKMGSDDRKENEKPVHTVTLDNYYIDQYEVTNTQFATFLNEQGIQPEDSDIWLDVESGDIRIRQAESEWRAVSGYLDHPITEVTWYGAQAYCKWRGEARLPTEAEWEKAARGTDGRKYPWGEPSPNKKLLNFSENVKDTTPVDSYPDGTSPYGVYNMAGNVFEWVADYDNGYYLGSSETNPTGPTPDKSGHITRGGGWMSSKDAVYTTYRRFYSPDKSFSYVGFRCARSP